MEVMFTATQQKSPELTVLGSLSAVFFVTVLGLACLRTEDTPSPAARCSDDNGDGGAQYVAVGWIHRHFLDCGKDDTPKRKRCQRAFASEEDCRHSDFRLMRAREEER